MKRLSEEAFKSSKKIPLVVVLDNVRSLHNVGAVFRTCDAFLIEHIVLCGITSTPPHPEIHKTALGAEFTMKWVYESDTLTAITALKEDGYTLYAIEQVQDSIALSDVCLEPTKKYAIVLGNEVKGIQQSVVDACNGCVEIPQYGTKHSLNVSVAGGIVIWHFFERMKCF